MYMCDIQISKYILMNSYCICGYGNATNTREFFFYVDFAEDWITNFTGHQRHIYQLAQTMALHVFHI